MGSACLRNEMMVIEGTIITDEEAGCYSKALVAVNLSLAAIDIVIAVIAFYQVHSILCLLLLIINN